MSRRLLVRLASAVVVATSFLVPAVAQGALSEHKPPRFVINGVVAGPSKVPVVYFGTLSLENGLFGKVTCEVLADGAIWNEKEETERGRATWDGWDPYLCSSPTLLACKDTFLSAEEGAELVEEEVTKEGETERLGKKEKVTEKVTLYAAKRGISSLPWEGELIERQNAASEREVALRTGKIKVYLRCPETALEVPYEGTLSPGMVNGVVNGLHPSHFEYFGKSGQYKLSGRLLSTECAVCLESEPTYVEGSITPIGTNEQLIQGK